MQYEPTLHDSPVRRRLLKGAIVSGLVLFSVALGFLLADGLNRTAILALALPTGLLAMLLVVRHASVFIMALPLAAMFLPRLEMPTGTTSTLPLSLLLAVALSGLWFTGAMLRGIRLKPSPLNKPLLIFSAICIVSLGWGIVWRDPILINWPDFIETQIGALITILMSMTAALLIGNYVTTERQLKFIFGAFVVSGTAVTATLFFKIPQTVLNDRGLVSMWAVACLFGLLIMQPGIRWHWRLALGAILLMNLYQTMVVNSLWISGWLPSLVVIAALIFVRSPKLFFALLPVAILIIVGAIGFFESVAQDNVNEGGLERLIIWQQNWLVVKDHWLLGTGPAGYAIYYMSYFPEEARSTHNNYLDIVAQFGFLGLGVWFWLSAAGAWEGWQLTRRLRPGLKRTVAAVAVSGWVSALAAMLLGDWVLPFAYNQGITGYKYTVYTWIFLGMLIVIRQLAEAEARAATQADG